MLRVLYFDDPQHYIVHLDQAQILPPKDILSHAWGIISFKMWDSHRLNTCIQNMQRTCNHILLIPEMTVFQNHLKEIMKLPVRAVFLDVLHNEQLLGQMLDNDEGKAFCLGVVHAQNPALTDLNEHIRHIERVVNQIGLRRVIIAPHRLYDETEMIPSVLKDQKKNELQIMARAMNEGKMAVQKELEENRRLI